MVVRPTIVYRSGNLVMQRGQREKLNVAELKMLRCGVSRVAHNEMMISRPLVCLILTPGFRFMSLLEITKWSPSLMQSIL